MSKPATIAGVAAFAGGQLATLIAGVDVVTSSVCAAVVAVIVGLFVAGVTMRHESRLARRIRNGQ